MNVFLLRHGRAGKWNPLRYPDDRLRPLTPEGQDRLTGQVRGMAAIGISPDLIVSSPLTRALQTAQIVHAGLALTRPIETSESLVPEADPRDALKELATWQVSSAGVMLVGHEPHLSSLASIAVGESADAVLRLRKGALCRIRLHLAPYGHSGWIEWSLTAQQMLAMAPETAPL